MEKHLYKEEKSTGMFYGKTLIRKKYQEKIKEIKKFIRIKQIITGKRKWLLTINKTQYNSNNKNKLQH